MPLPKHNPRLSAVWAALTLCIGCSQPDGLHVGVYELPYATVLEAQNGLHKSFPKLGIKTLRSHLMLFGLGSAAVLHQAHPHESALAFEASQPWLERLQQGEPFLEVAEQWAKSKGWPLVEDSPQLPNPSSLGAMVAATVAGMEKHQWAGPLQTAYGWEIIYLDQRYKGTRDRAQVSLYRILFPVGTDRDRAQAKQDWDTLPLSGNPGLIQSLPLSFRNHRTAPEPR